MRPGDQAKFTSLCEVHLALEKAQAFDELTLTIQGSLMYSDEFAREIARLDARAAWEAARA